MDGLEQIITPVSVATSALLGLMIGALYGYDIAPMAPLRFPWTLWSIGIAFIVMIAIFTQLSVPDTGTRLLAFAVGRGVLWTVTCLSIPLGRFIRGKFTR